ncbi:MAG: LTA synthase family protein [Endomicrobiales bacterium]|nr:LTA synthase family protein [Endomicrobiales bacterium]
MQKNKKINFAMVVDTTLWLIAMNAIFLLLMSAFRVVFFITYAPMDQIRGLGKYVFDAFVLGARFDLVQVAFINSLVTLTLLLLWAFANKSLFNKWLSVLKYYYTVLYCIVFTLLIVDIGFYSFFNDHINIMFFGFFEDDTKALITTIWENYNVVLVALAYSALIAIVYFISSRFIKLIAKRENENKTHHPVVKTIFVALLLFGNFVAARGTLSMFPLDIMDSAISPNAFINKVPLNGVYTFYRALEFRLKEDKSFNLASELGYGDGYERAFADYLRKDVSQINKTDLLENIARTTPKNIFVKNNPPNVVFFVMESFASHLTYYNSSNFNVLGEFKKHFDSDCTFMNFLPADIGTIGTFESIIMNIPKRPESKYITQSAYAYSSYKTSMALPYKNAGYETIFIYGGNIGWRNIGEFVALQGFDQVEGEGAMDPSFERNQWGVYDEYLFDYVLQKLNENTTKPKFIFVLTTSNHPPYKLPSIYKQLPLNVSADMKKDLASDTDLVEKRMIAYQYATRKLGKFMDELKSSQLGKKTIVAVTGDHSFHFFNYGKEKLLKTLSVPFYLFVPSAYKTDKYDKNTFGSHIDIMPTLYNLSLYEQKYYALGQNIFDTKAEHFSCNAIGVVISKDGAIEYSQHDKVKNFYTWQNSENSALQISNETKKLGKLFKCYKAYLAVADYVVKNPDKKKVIK